MKTDKRVSEPANSASKSELRNTWEKAAPGWAKWEHAFSTGLSAATDMLLHMAGIQLGMRVLDLACGAGSQTIQAAKRVGPHGSVVACDISATMLDHVRQNATAAGLQNVETVECAAEDLDETLPPFDFGNQPVGTDALSVAEHRLEGYSARIETRRAICGPGLYYARQKSLHVANNGHPSALCEQIAS